MQDHFPTRTLISRFSQQAAKKLFPQLVYLPLVWEVEFASIFNHGKKDLLHSKSLL